MFDIEATVTVATPTELKLTADCPSVGWKHSEVTRFNVRSQ